MIIDPIGRKSKHKATKKGSKLLPFLHQVIMRYFTASITALKASG